MARTTFKISRLLIMLAATAGSATSAAALERWVEVVNRGGSAIWSVQISHIDRPTWGPDLLGQYVIQPGGTMIVEPYNHQGYCRFDVLVAYETGPTFPLSDINLCEARSIHISDGGYVNVAY